MKVRDKWIIYVLKDPLTLEVRYVGITSRTDRLRAHIWTSKRDRSHRAHWVRGLVGKGLRPIMETVEQGSGAGGEDAEKRWISNFRRDGARLTNATDGGEGTVGLVHSTEWRAAMAIKTKKIHTGMKRSEEARQRMREAQRKLVAERQEWSSSRGKWARTEEILRRQSIAHTGKVMSEETKRKISKASSEAPEERRKKWADAMSKRPKQWRDWFAKNQKGKPKSDAHRRKISEALKGIKRSEASIQKRRDTLSRRKAGASSPD